MVNQEVSIVGADAACFIETLVSHVVEFVLNCLTLSGLLRKHEFKGPFLVVHYFVFAQGQLFELLNGASPLGGIFD